MPMGNILPLKKSSLLDTLFENMEQITNCHLRNFAINQDSVLLKLIAFPMRFSQIRFFQCISDYHYFNIK